MTKAKLRRYLSYGVLALPLSSPTQRSTEAPSASTRSLTSSHHSTMDSKRAMPKREAPHEQAAHPNVLAQVNNSVIPQSTYQNPSVRVCVAEADHITIVTYGHTIVSDTSGTGIAALQDNAAYPVTKSPNGLQISTAPLPSAVWITSADGFVQISDRQYRGSILLISTGMKVIAVNVLPIEDYIKSVVGSEVYGNWHPEALKAQAVAARSYALSRMQDSANVWFDLYADERDQAYKGIGAETPATIAAAAATEGQVLVQADGAVLMAQYAATDEITQRAHHGAGMSQFGAHRLAQQGNDYLTILSKYYRGARLAQLS